MHTVVSEMSGIKRTDGTVGTASKWIKDPDQVGAHSQCSSSGPRFEPVTHGFLTHYLSIPSVISELFGYVLIIKVVASFAKSKQNKQEGRIFKL